MLEDDNKRYNLKDGSMPGDLNKDGVMSGYEQARQNAIEKNMRDQKSIGGTLAKEISKLIPSEKFISKKISKDIMKDLNDQELISLLNIQREKVKELEKYDFGEVVDIPFSEMTNKQKAALDLQTRREAIQMFSNELKKRQGYQEGGEIDNQMSMLMNNEQEPPMESDEEMEDNYIDFILDEALSEEEEDMLMSKLEQDEQLAMLFDKVVEVASEFAGSGPVEGPGTGVSDSIPARLSDGEFVFTAKAVEEIGADELMRMMKDAEMRADERQGMANGGEMDEETVVVKGDDEPARQEIRVVKETVDAAGRMTEDEDEISKGIKSQMMLDPNQRHVRS